MKKRAKNFLRKVRGEPQSIKSRGGRDAGRRLSRSRHTLLGLPANLSRACAALIGRRDIRGQGKGRGAVCHANLIGQRGDCLRTDGAQDDDDDDDKTCPTEKSRRQVITRG